MCVYDKGGEGYIEGNRGVGGNGERMRGRERVSEPVTYMCYYSIFLPSCCVSMQKRNHCLCMS